MKLPKGEKIIQIANDLDRTNHFLLLTNKGTVYDLKINRKIQRTYYEDKSLNATAGEIESLSIKKVDL